jgi:hypothetical protein
MAALDKYMRESVVAHITVSGIKKISKSDPGQFALLASAIKFDMLYNLGAAPTINA